MPTASERIRSMANTSDHQDSTVDEELNHWKAEVNMTASALEKWLDAEESKAVGQKEGGESVGHKSGRRIVELLGTS